MFTTEITTTSSALTGKVARLPLIVVDLAPIDALKNSKLAIARQAADEGDRDAYLDAIMQAAAVKRVISQIVNAHG